MTKITFTSILSTSKVAIAAFGIVGTLYAAFVAFHTFIDSNNDIKETVELSIKNDTIVFQQLHKINRNLEMLNAKSDKTTKKVDALQGSYIQFLNNNNALTKQDFIKYMMSLDLGTNVELKKKEQQYLTQQNQK